MTLDRSAQQVLTAMAAAQAQGAPQMHQVSPAQAREMYHRSQAMFGTAGPQLLEVRDLTIPVPMPPTGNEQPIGARLYRDHSGQIPLVIYYHGGGWVIGDLDTHDGLCRRIAKQSGFAVLSIDYRLAPEHPFPAAVDDAYAALKWAATHSERLNIDENRIAVAGDSAGGNLSAVVAQLAKTHNGPPIRMQALLYPATDMHGDYESRRTFTEYLLTPETYRWFGQHYFSSPSEPNDVRASPIRCADLSELPPAFVLTAGFDPLRDEGKAYADQLREAGVNAVYRCFTGQIHGFLTLDKIIPQASEAIDELTDALKTAMS